MKNPLPLIIFLILTTICKAQDIVVADAVDKTPIPFVTVKFNDTGLYTNEKGILRTDLTKTKSLELHHLGYKTLEINTGDIQDTILMHPQAALLNEVVINAKRENSIQLKPLKSNRSFGDTPIPQASEIFIVMHPKNDLLNFFVDEVTIPFRKRNRWDRKDYLEGTRAFVRINIYEVKNNLPSTQIYSSDPITIQAQEKDEIKLDLTDLYIQFNENGLSFGIEFLGYYDGNENPIKSDNNLPLFFRPTLTGKSSKSYTATTYRKYIFDKETHITPINDIINRDDGFLDREYYRNLSIGLKLSNLDPDK